MAKVTLTIEVEQEVYEGLGSVILRPEFSVATLDADTKQYVQRSLYPTVEEFLAKVVILPGLQNFKHLIPAAAAMQRSVDDKVKAIQDFLTPTVTVRS